MKRPLMSFAIERSGAVAVEMAAVFGLLTVALLGLVEVGISQTQQKYADHAFAVFSELLMSHRGDVTCEQIDEYFTLAVQTFNTGNVGPEQSQGNFTSGSEQPKSKPIRLRVAGVEIERDSNGSVRQVVKWHSRKDFSTEYSLGPQNILPTNLEIEGQFYFVVEGRTYLYPAFNLLSGGGEPLIEDIEPHIFLPRYQSTTDMTGTKTSWCEFAA